jgi:sugar transferase (PEP-CTERM/EpsH1 system associated)
MKILCIIPYTPNLIRVRPYNIIRSLAARGNEVTLLTITNGALDEEAVRGLRADGITVKAFALPTWRSMINAARGLLTRDPVQSFYCWHSGMANEAYGMASQPGRYDVVHVEHLRGARYAEFLKQSPIRIPIVWDSVDSITYLFRQAAQQSMKRSSRMITRLELPRTARYEGRMAALFDAALVTSPVDRQALLDLIPADEDGAGERIHVLPNGVDLQFFQPDPEVKREPETLVVSGKMSYHANVSMTLHMVNEILPQIWAQKPETRLEIVGKDPPAEIARLAEDPRIRVSGYVPDIRPYLHRAAVAVAPLTYGAGIQNKVLEAMACGAPVVTTPLAARNLSAVPSHELMVAAEPAEFARAVVSLLDNPTRREAMGAAGRRYVETCHDWQTIAGSLEQIYAEAVKRR